MKRLSNKELASIINSYGYYKQWSSQAEDRAKIFEPDSSIQREHDTAEWLYYSHMCNELEMKLAEHKIYIHGDLSKKRFLELDKESMNEKWQRLHNRYHEAIKQLQSN